MRQASSRARSAALIRRIHLEARARLEGDGAWLEVLEDWRVWAEAPAALQDKAIAAVQARLGDAWVWAGTQTFERGDRRFRLAVFRLRVGQPQGKPGWLERLVDPSAALQVELALVPGGRLELGETEGAPGPDGSAPLARGAVQVAPFLLGRAPLLQRAWDALGGEDMRRHRFELGPIHGISWEDAEIWMAAAGGGLRFPSEVEWEYSCRLGGAVGAWSEARSGGRPSKSPEEDPELSALGLRSMLGQVWEWCADEHRLEAAPRDGRAYGETGGYDARPRVLRGGGYDSPEAALTEGLRRGAAQDERQPAFGLRVARSIF